MQNENDDNIALFIWLKKQREADEKHAAVQVRIRERDDKLYVSMLAEMLTKRTLNIKTRILCLNFAKHKHNGKNFTPSQRSTIAAIYYK